PVVFTSNQADPPPGAWQGLVLAETSDVAGCEFVWCRFEYAQTGLSVSGYERLDPVLARDCTFWRMGTGVFCTASGADPSSVALEGCRFTDFEYGLRCSENVGGTVALAGCSLVQEGGGYVGHHRGIQMWRGGELVADHCEVRGAETGVYLERTSAASFSYSTIADHAQYGIWCRQDSYEDPHLAVNFSELSGNGTYAVTFSNYADPSLVMNLENNWWARLDGAGCNDSTCVAELIYDHLDGDENNNRPYADFMPFVPWDESSDVPEDTDPGMDDPARFHCRLMGPNPFAGATVLRFGLPRQAPVTISVHDPAGRLVRHLKNGVLGSGWHEVPWDGRNDRGHRTGQGIYFLRLQAGPWMSTHKVLVVD
ncbi:MAG: T9SS type A sorting domain-containing protein, partial [Candidatus Eisenbacteria bacterium]|nr:T9SS type A sorting domain-containing protein [Candidatus Eisenbacteria bacterium]